MSWNSWQPRDGITVSQMKKWKDPGEVTRWAWQCGDAPERDSAPELISGKTKPWEDQLEKNSLEKRLWAAHARAGRTGRGTQRMCRKSIPRGNREKYMAAPIEHRCTDIYICVYTHSLYICVYVNWMGKNVFEKCFEINPSSKQEIVVIFF